MDRFEDVQVLANEDDARAMLAAPDGRTIVATPDEHNSIDLVDFRFAPGDRIVFGNEYHGLPPDVTAMTKHRVTVPMYGPVYERPDQSDGISPPSRITRDEHQRCLSLISSVSIVLYAAVFDTSGFRGWKETNPTTPQPAAVDNEV